MSVPGGVLKKVLSIAVPSYNAEPYLDNCLTHFIDSGVMERLEILIVDDGSTDSTQTMAESYEQRFPGSVVVISKENGGHGSTINAAIPRASGKYFKVVDVDDWVEPENLASLVDALEDIDADLVLNPIYVYQESMGRKQLYFKRIFREYPSLEKHDFSDLKFTAPIMMHEITYRTQMLQTHPEHIDEHTFYVDAEYMLYNLAHVETVVICDKPVYVYRFGSPTQSISHANLMRNVEQHRRVAISCMSFWNKNLSSFDAAHEKCFRLQLSRMISDQYHIYLNFRPSVKLRRALKQWHADCERLMTVHGKPTLGPLVTLMILFNFRGLWVYCLANGVRLAATQALMTFLMSLKPANDATLSNIFGEKKSASRTPPTRK